MRRQGVGKVGEVTECLLFVLLTLPCLPSLNVLLFFLSSKSQSNCGVLQALSFSEKRGACGALLLCEQSKMARMISKGRKVRLTKAVPEGVRSRAPPPPEATPLRPMWPGPPKEPPAVVNEMQVADAKPDLDFDAWNARERVIIRAMENFFAKVSEEILVEVGDLEACSLCPQ